LALKKTLAPYTYRVTTTEVSPNRTSLVVISDFV
jgi:hypothetical protein